MADQFNCIQLLDNQNNNVTIELDGDTGEATVGGNGQDGTLVMKNATNSTSLFFSADDAEVVIGNLGTDGRLEIEDAGNQTSILLRADQSLITAGGGDAASGRLSLGKAGTGNAIELDADNATAELGRQGTGGRLRLKDFSDTTTVFLSGTGASLQLGNTGEDGEFFMSNSSGDITIRMNGDQGRLELGNNVTSNNTSIVIDGVSGRIGIGDTNPQAPLHVQGRVGLESQSGGQLWNLNVLQTGGLTFNANSASGGTTRMFIDDNNGNVGIGTTSPTQKLQVVGNICATGSIGQCSDQRFKRDIQPLTDCLNSVLAMCGVRYQWKQTEFPQHEFTGNSQIGFIGQEVENLCPEIVTTDAEGFKFLDYARLTPILVEAIKEQQQLIQEQTSALGVALTQLAQLETTVQALAV